MLDRALMQERMIKEAMAEKEHTFQDTVDEMKAVREAQNEGCWRVILAGYFQEPDIEFVSYSEEGQYKLMSHSKYKTQEKARLALALMTRPSRLVYTEWQQLLVMLEE